MRRIWVQILSLCLFISAYPCTDFVITSRDRSFVNGRSLEFGLHLESKIKVFPRQQQIKSSAPGQKKGMEWVSKYGYLGVNALGIDCSFDGMNEKGLSFGYLWLPGITQYPTVPKEAFAKALDFLDFGAWALGNFSTVQEVKEALQNVYIWGHAVPSLGVAPVHAALHDAQGGHLVVEFIQGKMRIYENPLGILTNSPSFDWHLANLQNYLNLNAENPPSAPFAGMMVHPVGQGGGLLGLPGDFSPPSRFIKTATLIHFSQECANGAEAINLAEHILNAVDIPLGAVREAKEKAGDYTQWIVIKDLSQKVFYFRSYSDLSLKKIDLKKLNLSREIKNSLPLDMKRGYFDVTDLF